jgi:hypothetical protein
MNENYVIDGVTYVEVDREAEVGDKVIRNEQLEFVGRVYDVYSAYSSSIGRGVLCKHTNGHAHLTNYRVLEPLESEVSPSVTDLLANLANRVHSLEQQLRDTQRNIERQAEELENAKQSIESAEVFDLAGIKSFKLSDLNGKTLRIYVSTDFADGVSVTTTVAIDINDGRMYVLDNEVIVE